MRSGGTSNKGRKPRASGERDWFIADGKRRGPGIIERSVRGVAGAYPLLASAAVAATIAYNMHTPASQQSVVEASPAIIDTDMRQRAMPVADFQYGFAPQPDTFIVPDFSAPLTSQPVNSQSEMVTTSPADTPTSAHAAFIPNAKPAVIPAAITDATPAPKARISVVIDDMGLRQSMTRRFAALEAPLTFAFLPYASGLQWQTKAMSDAGHELMLHLPMEPYAQIAGARRTDNPGPKALLSGLDRAELQARLVWNLSRFAGFKGINNHMGSRLTEDAGAMDVVMGALQGQGLYFLDSRTSADSVAAKAAQAAGLKWQERDVFIDNDRDIAAVLQQLQEAERIALAGGSAIAIGHPYDVTLDALVQWIPTLDAKGIELVFASKLMHGPADLSGQRVAGARPNGASSAPITAGGGE